MEMTLKRDIFEHQALVWSGMASRDFTAECIVPDAMPDVGSVVDAEGIIILRSKETDSGSVLLGASVSVSVIYMPDGAGAIQSLPVTVPVELRMDAPGADSDCRTVIRMRVRALDARVVNSRKLAVRADVDCEARVYQRRSLEIASGLEREDASIHMLTRTASMTTVADVREKTFITMDEYQLPAGTGGVEQILSQRVEPVVEDVKYVSGKVVFRGRIRAGLVFGCPDGSVFAGRYETEFSQIMEVEVDSEDAVPELSIMLTGAYFDLPERREEDGRIAAEIHVVAQCICSSVRELTYIADLYSNRTVLIGEKEPIAVASAVQPISMRQTVTGSTDPVGGGPGEVLTLSAAIGSIAVEDMTVKTAVNIRVISRQSDGRFTVARCRLTAEFTTDLPAGTELQSVTVSAADVYCAATGGGLDVRAVLQMEALAVSTDTVHCVMGITEDAAAWADAPATPSITLARVEPGTDMWTVAKKYHSTVEAIAAANGDRASGLLLIPKSR